MGTRSITKFIETSTDNNKKQRKETITAIYRQMDGYPSGMGADLGEILSKGKLVNGIGMGKDFIQFNGMGCLAATVIKELKNGSGGIYVVKPNVGDSGQDYEYHITGNFNTHDLNVKCFTNGYMSKTNKYVNKKKLLFDGTVTDFVTFCNKSE